MYVMMERANKKTHRIGAMKCRCPEQIYKPDSVQPYDAIQYIYGSVLEHIWLQA